MRAHLLAAALFASIFALPACAQTAPTNLFFDASELPAAIAKLKAARVGDQPLVLQPRIINMPPYRVQLEYRPGIAPATVHEADAELMFIVQGAGAIVTGGKLADEKRTNPTNLAGSSIVGGQSRGIKPGDVVMIPNSVAHQVIPASGQEVVIVSVHMPNPLQSGWIWP